MQKDYVPYGSDVSAGTYECVDCGHEVFESVTKHRCHRALSFIKTVAFAQWLESPDAAKATQ